jgi:predicted phosphoadenosine phosphosulfate sulfurtransferase
MSKNFWQTRKQNEQLRHGKSLTSRIEAWVESWESRCYAQGIPDEVPHKLTFSGRAPSWKAIAVCILGNDHQLSRLGLSRNETQTGLSIEAQLKALREAKESGQEQLF